MWIFSFVSLPSFFFFCILFYACLPYAFLLHMRISCCCYMSKNTFCSSKLINQSNYWVTLFTHMYKQIQTIWAKTVRAPYSIFSWFLGYIQVDCIVAKPCDEENRQGWLLNKYQETKNNISVGIPNTNVYLVYLPKVKSSSKLVVSLVLGPSLS